jgi:hypothetical protein
MNPIIRVPALVPSLRCPDRRCEQPVVYMHAEERFRGLLKCTRSSCPTRARWFAEPLEPGEIRPQLEIAYLDPQIALDLMYRFRLPDAVGEPMYLQIPLTRELWSDYLGDQDPRPRNRSIRLIRNLLTVLH